MQLKRVFFHYWKEIKKYKGIFYLMFIAYGAGVFLADVLNPFLYKKIIDLISGSTPSILIGGQLFQIVFYIFIVVLSYQIFYRLGDYLIITFEANVMREIHNYTFSELVKQSYKFFSNNFSGSLVAKAKRFSSSFEKIIDIITFNFWFTFIQMTGVFVVLFINVPKVAFILLLWAIVYMFITILFVRKKIEYDILEASADSKVTASFSDVIANILNVKIFSGREKEKKIFKDVTLDEYQKRKKAWLFGNFQNTIQGLLMGTAQVIVLYTMVSLWLKGSISTGTVVLIQVYMFGVFDHLWFMGRALVQLFKALAEAKEMTDLLDKKPAIMDIPNPEKCLINEGKINFENVRFEYTKGHGVFKDFTFEIAPGEKIGLVGHSGSGKTTIVKMLLRFSDVKEGRILIDGQDISKIKQDELRSVISYVPQEPILFHRTIKENIAYSTHNATDEEIKEAARKAHADEFIMKLPYGYETLVGERGIKLSGGERQRIAIARAMLKHAPILLLDEATSSLDSISESYIQDAFNELMKGKTAIVIAHRLSTVQKMDRIVVLEKGKIVENGTHKELLEKNGYYAELWNHQTGGFLK